MVLLLPFFERLFFCHIISVLFTNYTICIISNLFYYSIQNYEAVPLANKKQNNPDFQTAKIMNVSANHLIVEYSTVQSVYRQRQL